MALGITEAIRRLVGGDDDSEEERRFVPSLLDWSVRHSHGGSGDERARELADVREQARDLEAERRE
jgi:hypothetical protein